MNGVVARGWWPEGAYCMEQCICLGGIVGTVTSKASGFYTLAIIKSPNYQKDATVGPV
jgi:hypothetical protein